jgi:hypothetical protein
MAKRRKKISPNKNDWENLSSGFQHAAQGHPDAMRDAARTAKAFDNQFGTDFVSIIAQAIRKKPKYVRDGKFTTSEKTYDRAVKIFSHLSESFPKAAANELSRASRMKPETTRHESFRPPVAVQRQRRATFPANRAA